MMELMRTYSERYRDLFPATVLGSVQDATTGAWRHAFRELMPAGADAYSSAPGFRSGATDQNYALEINNVRTAPGTNVWVRHRDEQGLQLHFEFVAPCLCCGCEPCYQGVMIVGPALAWVDADGGWAAVDLTGKAGGVVGIGPGDVPATFDSLSGGSW